MNKEEETRFIVSADIGGSHITASVIDMGNKAVIKATRVRAPVDCDGTAEEILDAWAGTIKEAIQLSRASIKHLALAMPGPFDYKNGISYIKGLHKYESLYAVNIKEQLRVRLPISAENILFRNDAEAFLHGEIISGAGQGYGDVIGFTLGTGMGSARSTAGFTADLDWGSVTFGDTIADDYFSTRWFLKAYQEIAGVQCRNVKEFVELVDKDVKVREVFDVFAGNFAGFISSFIRHKKTDCILIGGNIANAHHLFIKQLSAHLTEYISPSKIVIATLGEDAALIGAAFNFSTPIVVN